MMINAKEDVIVWFRHQSAALRVETLCSLLECCVPFEIRFIGTVLETLGRQDFHELRDAEHRANSFMTPTSTLDENRLLLLSSLVNDTSSVPSNGGIGQASFSTLNQHQKHNSSVNLSDESNKSTFRSPTVSNLKLDSRESSTSNRPSQLGEDQQKNVSNRTADGRPPLSNNIGTANNKAVTSANNSNSTQSKPQLVNGVSPYSTFSTDKLIESQLSMIDQSSALAISSGDSEDDIESGNGDGHVLLNEKIRRRMILYLSLLTATNRDGANTFYTLLASSEIPQAGGFDRLPDSTIVELALLFTIAFYHPAFTFNQHIIISDILMQIKISIYRRTVQAGVAYMTQQFDPKTGQVWYQPVHFPAAQIQHMNAQHQQPVYHQVQPQQVVPTSIHMSPSAPALSMGGSSGTAQIPPLNTGMPTSPTPITTKPALVDTTQPSNQPPLPYYHPPNGPVFMGHSPPSHNHVLNSIYSFPNPNPNSQINILYATQSNNGSKIAPANISNHVEVLDNWNIKKGREQGALSPLVNGHEVQPQMIEHNQINPPPRSRNMSCFNCGSQTHYGQDCKESSMEDMTRHLYRLNFNRPNIAESS